MRRSWLVCLLAVLRYLYFAVLRSLLLCLCSCLIPLISLFLTPSEILSLPLPLVLPFLLFVHIVTQCSDPLHQRTRKHLFVLHGTWTINSFIIFPDTRADNTQSPGLTNSCCKSFNRGLLSIIKTAGVAVQKTEPTKKTFVWPNNSDGIYVSIIPRHQ